MSNEHTIELWCLGTWRVSIDGVDQAPLPTRYARALLACLALSPGEALARAELQTLLFPGAEGSRAGQHLRTTIYYVRRMLGPYIWSTADQLALRGATISTDVERFRTLIRPDAALVELLRGLALYRGDFLEVPPEGWATDTATQLQQQYTRALRRAVALVRATGRLPLLHQVAERWLQAEPWEDDAHRAVIQSLLEQGDHAGAVAQLARSHRQLQLHGRKQTLSTLLAELAVQIDSFGTVRSETPGAARARPGTPPGPLVGRAAELQQLTAAVARAASGQSQVLELVGAAGMGKTRLLTSFADWLRTTGRGHVRVATITPQIGAQSYGTLAALLAQDDDLALPQMQALPDTDGHARVTGPHAQHPTSSQLLALAASAQPLVLLLDQEVPVDAGSAAELTTLVLIRPALAIVLTRRPDMQSSIEPVTERIDLSPLDEAAIGALASAMLAGPIAPALARRLSRLSYGKPTLAQEHLLEDILRGNLVWSSPIGWDYAESPDSSHQPADRRAVQVVDQLQPAVMDLLTFLVVRRAPLGLGILREAWQASSALEAALAEAEQLSLVHRDEELIMLAHPSLRASVLARQPAARIDEIRRRLLMALQRAGEAPIVQMRLALDGALWRDAFEAAVVAGEHGLQSERSDIQTAALDGGLAAAAHCWPELSPTQQWRWLVLKEDLVRRNVRGREWSATLQELEELANQMADPERQVEARLRLGSSLRERGQPAVAEHILRLCAEDAVQHNNARQETLARIARVGALDDNGAVDLAYAEAAAAVRTAARTADPLLEARALSMLSYMELRCGQVSRAEALLRPLLDRLDVLRQPALHARFSRQLGIIRMAARDADDALRLLRESVRLAQRTDDPYVRLLCQTSLCYELIRVGFYTDGQPLGEATLELARHLDARTQVNSLLTTLAAAALYTGDLDHAHLLAEESMAVADIAERPEYVVSSRCILARILLVRGAPQQAAAIIAQLDQIQLDDRYPTVQYQSVAAAVWQASGHTARARHAAERALTAIPLGLPTSEVPGAIWEAARVLQASDAEAARPHFRRAFDLFLDEIGLLTTPALRKAYIKARPVHTEIAALRGGEPRMLTTLPTIGTMTRRIVRDDDLVPVIWQLQPRHAGEKESLWRQRQIELLTESAMTQGALATVNTLAEILGVSPRTVLRDLKQLRHSGRTIQTLASMVR